MKLNFLFSNTRVNVFSPFIRNSRVHMKHNSSSLQENLLFNCSYESDCAYYRLFETAFHLPQIKKILCYILYHVRNLTIRYNLFYTSCSMSFSHHYEIHVLSFRQYKDDNSSSDIKNLIVPPKRYIIDRTLDSFLRNPLKKLI